MDPVTAAVAERGIARLADYLFTAALAGLAREPIIDKVRKMEADGATPDQITDTLQADRQQSEIDAQRQIDEARARGQGSTVAGEQKPA